MKRKVLKVGNASLAVSLPSKWVKGRGIKPGDELEVNESEGGLHIGAATRAHEREITIDAPEGELFVKRIILSPYVQGYDIIHIRYAQPATRKRIQNVLNHMMGFEITAEQRGRVTLTNVARGVEEQFSSLFFRMFHLTVLLGETLAEAAKTKDRTLLEEMGPYEQNQTKLHNFCKRILNTQSRMSLKQTTASYRIVATLEEIGDRFRDITKTLQSRKKFPDIGDEARRIAELTKYTGEIFRKPTLTDVAEQRNQTMRLNEELELRAEKGGADAAVYIRLSDIASSLRELTLELLYPFNANR